MVNTGELPCSTRAGCHCRRRHRRHAAAWRHRQGGRHAPWLPDRGVISNALNFSRHQLQLAADCQRLANRFCGDGGCFQRCLFHQKTQAAVTNGPAVRPSVLLIKELPGVEGDWLNFYRNYLDVLNGKGGLPLKRRKYGAQRN